jgi:hypothetical protein
MEQRRCVRGRMEGRVTSRRGPIQSIQRTSKRGLVRRTFQSRTERRYQDIQLILSKSQQPEKKI